MAGRVFQRRQFLNTDEYGGSAHIEAYVTETETSGSGEPHLDAEFSVADCNRKVTLNFNVWGRDNVANVRTKVQRLRRALVAFEAALEAQLKVIDGK